MIDALALTGAYLEQHALEASPAGSVKNQLYNQFYRPFENAICSEHTHNGWFTEKLKK